MVDLDLIELLTNPAEPPEDRSDFYKKTKETKLGLDNFLPFKNLPVEINDSFKFGLNSNTKYLNIFLWTSQFLNKTIKNKNLLIGYVRGFFI